MHPDSRPVRTALACLLLAASTAAPCTHAATVHRYERVRMEVVDRDSGEPLTAIRHEGEDWIAGEPGRPYAIRLTNTSSGRVLVVVSVDGINAVSGETADPSQTGYVLGPHQTTEITGWRKSFEDVARFEFSAAGDSYAARSGRPDNVGTIGIAVFSERVPIRVGPPARPLARTAAAPAEAAGATMDSTQKIGTAHGAREHAPVSSTAFERASRTPGQISTLRYDSRQSLIARGILPLAPGRRPRAFPGQFVPDP